MGTAGRSATSSTMPFGSTSRWAIGAASAAHASTARRSGSRKAGRRMAISSVEGLSELEHGQREDGGAEDQERDEAGPDIAEAHPLEHDAADDAEKIRQRDDGREVLRDCRHAFDGKE